MSKAKSTIKSREKVRTGDRGGEGSQGQVVAGLLSCDWNVGLCLE